MSLNELAVDLTCEPADWIVTSSGSRTDSMSYPEEADLGAIEEEVDGGALPGGNRQHSDYRKKRMAEDEEQRYEVHGGMLKMARAMGAKGKPVHVAVRNALRRNHGYSKLPCWFRKLRSDSGLQIW